MAKTLTLMGLGRLPAASMQYDAQAFGNGEVIVASPIAALTSLAALNKSAGTLYLQFFDSATTPAGGATPLFIPIPLPAGVFVSIDLGDTQGEGVCTGVPFKTGLAWAVSSTPATLTADASSSVWLMARYFG